MLSNAKQSIGTIHWIEFIDIINWINFFISCANLISEPTNN
jgi:hypothetical protein